jgi:hypothetical protein
MTKWPVRLSAGLIAGIIIAAVDNFAFEGEISPIVIVAMLFAVTVAAGVIWGQLALIAQVAVWACVPLAHVINHVAGLPDSLHPNTYGSILKLAAFTLVIAVIGSGCGMLAHKLTRRSP